MRIAAAGATGWRASWVQSPWPKRRPPPPKNWRENHPQTKFTDFMKTHEVAIITHQLTESVTGIEKDTSQQQATSWENQWKMTRPDHSH